MLDYLKMVKPFTYDLGFMIFWLRVKESLEEDALGFIRFGAP